MIRRVALIVVQVVTVFWLVTLMVTTGRVTIVSTQVAVISSLVTAVGVVWLCIHIDRATKRFFLSAEAYEEANVVRHVTVTDALLRVEEAVTEARIAATRVAEKVNVTAELGFQNAEGQHRMEEANAEVAHDLAESIARADALPKSSDYGAAADAALRSAADDTPTKEEDK